MTYFLIPVRIVQCENHYSTILLSLCKTIAFAELWVIHQIFCLQTFHNNFFHNLELISEIVNMFKPEETSLMRFYDSHSRLT